MTTSSSFFYPVDEVAPPRCDMRRSDVERAAAAPVLAGFAVEEAFVDEVAAEGGGVVVPLAEHRVDLAFRIPVAGLEVLRQQVEDDKALRALSGDRDQPSVADEDPEHARRVGRHAF